MPYKLHAGIYQELVILSFNKEAVYHTGSLPLFQRFYGYGYTSRIFRMYPAQASTPEVTQQIFPTGMNHLAEPIRYGQYFQMIFHLLIEQHRNRRFFKKSFLFLVYRIGFFRYLYRRRMTAVTEKGNPVFSFLLRVVER